MPTYEYRCQDCGQEFDEFQRMSDEPRRECPKCHGRLKRLIGQGAGVLFKGSGFYQTDYRSESYTKAAEKEKVKKNGSAAAESGAKPESGSKPQQVAGSQPQD